MYLVFHEGNKNYSVQLNRPQIANLQLFPGTDSHKKIIQVASRKDLSRVKQNLRIPGKEGAT